MIEEIERLLVQSLALADSAGLSFAAVHIATAIDALHSELGKIDAAPEYANPHDGALASAAPTDAGQESRS